MGGLRAAFDGGGLGYDRWRNFAAGWVRGLLAAFDGGGLGYDR